LQTNFLKKDFYFKSKLKTSLKHKTGGMSTTIEAPDLDTLFKAIKNNTEISGFKAAHIRDGAAMVKSLYWLDQSVGKIKRGAFIL